MNADFTLYDLAVSTQLFTLWVSALLIMPGLWTSTVQNALFASSVLLKWMQTLLYMI